MTTTTTTTTTEEKRAEDEAKAEAIRAMMRAEREVRENAEAEARATARTPEGCNETDRPEWWDEEGEGDDIEHEAKARAEMTENEGPEAQEKEARTAEITAEDIKAHAKAEHADNAERKRRRQDVPDEKSASLRAEAEYHAEQVARWARAKAEANTSAERDRAAVQEARH